MMNRFETYFDANNTYYTTRTEEEFLAIKRAISLNETFVYFVEITTRETRHIQQIYIDEPSMQHCPKICIFKTGFPKCM